MYHKNVMYQYRTKAKILRPGVLKTNNILVQLLGFKLEVLKLN